MNHFVKGIRYLSNMCCRGDNPQPFAMCSRSTRIRQTAESVVLAAIVAFGSVEFKQQVTLLYKYNACLVFSNQERETSNYIGNIDGHRPGWPASRADFLRPAGRTGLKRTENTSKNNASQT